MASYSQSVPRPIAALSSWSSWMVAGAILVVAAVALCLLFAAETKGAYEVWLNSTAYNHCFLVLPVALYLAWSRRGALELLTPQSELKWLLLLAPLSLLWLSTVLIGVLELQQLLVVAMFEVVALAVLGGGVYRAMLAPLLYLFFLVPFGDFLVPYLQEWTAAFAVTALRLVGVPVYWDGLLIDVPSGNFIVAEAWAGLRFLIASVAFGVFFSALVYRSRVRWLAFVALSIVVPIIANGFRAFGIIGLSELTNNATAVEADHLIYGWAFFTAVTLLLIAIGLRFSDQGPGIDISAPLEAVRKPPAARPWNAALAGLLGIALATSGPAYAQLRDWRAENGTKSRFDAPSVKMWKPVSAALFDWQPVIEDPDGKYVGAYDNGGAGVILYIAFYREAGLHNNLVRGQNNIANENRGWRLVKSGSAVARVEGRESEIATTEIVGTSGARLLVWHFYVVDGRIAANPLRAKLLQLRNLFRSGGGTDAFVAVAADERTGPDRAQAALRGFLADFTPPGGAE